MLSSQEGFFEKNAMKKLSLPQLKRYLLQAADVPRLGEDGSVTIQEKEFSGVFAAWRATQQRITALLKSKRRMELRANPFKTFRRTPLWKSALFSSSRN